MRISHHITKVSAWPINNKLLWVKPTNTTTKPWAFHQWLAKKIQKTPKLLNLTRPFFAGLVKGGDLSSGCSFLPFRPPCWDANGFRGTAHTVPAGNASQLLRTDGCGTSMVSRDYLSLTREVTKSRCFATPIFCKGCCETCRCIGAQPIIMCAGIFSKPAVVHSYVYIYIHTCVCFFAVEQQCCLQTVCA